MNFGYTCTSAYQDHRDDLVRWQFGHFDGILDRLFDSIEQIGAHFLELFAGHFSLEVNVVHESFHLRHGFRVGAEDIFHAIGFFVDFQSRLRTGEYVFFALLLKQFSQVFGQSKRERIAAQITIKSLNEFNEANVILKFFF